MYSRLFDRQQRTRTTLVHACALHRVTEHFFADLRNDNEAMLFVEQDACSYSRAERSVTSANNDASAMRWRELR